MGVGVGVSVSVRAHMYYYHLSLYDADQRAAIFYHKVFIPGECRQY